MRIAIAGGTGTLGRQVADELRARGHEVRVLSRASTGHPVDLTTGRGLHDALEGCDTVVDTADAPTVRQARRTLVEGSRRLLGAGADAGAGHHVCVSVVGCDRVPAAYYGVKTGQERVVANGPVSWTVVRATQFHEYVAGMLDSAGRWRVLPVPRARIQPVAVAEVARAVADTAEGPPLRARTGIAGPETVDAREPARSWRAVTGRYALPLPLPGGLGRALRAGGATTARPDVRGSVPFAVWLGKRR